MTAAAQSQRIDKWLWCARFFRTREAAAAFVGDGNVRLTRAGRRQRIAKPSFALKLDDELSFLLSDRPVIVRIRAFPARRGPATMAASLYVRIGGC